MSSSAPEGQHQQGHQTEPALVSEARSAPDQQHQHQPKHQTTPSLPHPLQPHHFSRIYLEKDARSYPATERILGNLAPLNPQVIEIDHYADVFNRPRQHFAVQKLNPALILAVERGRLLYKGTERINSWSQGDFYYNALVRNCVYNCEYCFLQGMHEAAHTLMFVNTNDFMQAVEREAEQDRQAVARSAEVGRAQAEGARSAGAEQASLYLSISYLSDLLAFEPLYPYCAEWIEFTRSQENISIEIRTKSDYYHCLAHLEPHPRVYLVWSISPQAVASSLERGCASFQNRIFAASRAAQRGWKVKLCFDPVLAVPNWRTMYPDMLAKTFGRIAPSAVSEVSYGVFRMNSDYLRKMRSMNPMAASLRENIRSTDGLASYSPELLAEIREVMDGELRKYLPPERISFVHG